MKALWHILKNSGFTVTVLGVVVGWVPLRWFERHARWPEQWTGLHFAALTLGTLALGVFLHCQWLLATRGQGTPAPIDPPKKLVRRGAYKWVRNPLYLALFALIGSEALFLRSGHVAVYFVCLVCAIHVYVLLFEEEAMRRRFGAIYEDYRREVPRWLPRKPRPMLQTIAPFPH